MDEGVFSALEPVCPRCLHHASRRAPLVIASRDEVRDGRIWHGALHCSDSACWMEYPIIDGVPLLVPDPAGTLKSQQQNLLWRTDFPDTIRGMLGDCFGAGDAYDTMRYHLSLYGGDHYAGWGAPGTPGVEHILDWGLSALGKSGAVDGPSLDLGGSVGRGGWTLAKKAGAPAVVADLNLSMLRFGQQLALEGRITLDLRRVGVVYDPVELEVPADWAGSAPDFWAVDAVALPFDAERFGVIAGINLVDCTSHPANVIGEIGRVLRPGGGVVLATPYDWSPQAVEMAQWMGGHSQRGAYGGAAEPVLLNALKQVRIEDALDETDLTWRLRLHARSTMEYRVHALVARKSDAPFPS